MKIRPRRNPSGKIVYQLDLGEGPGQRTTYKTKGEAEAELKKEEQRRAKFGRVMDGITSVELAEIVNARDRLREADATITEAVEFFLQHGRRLKERLLLPELVKRFRNSRIDLELSDSYVTQLKTSIGSLARMYPLTQAHDLTPKDVQAWIQSGGWEAKTRNNYLGDVSSMYEWALLPTQGYARVNPCVDIERAPKKRRGKTAAHTAEQAELMLRAAHGRQDWRMLAYLVVTLFGGLRPEAEAIDQKLLWSDVDLHERHIHLTEQVVKTGPGRTVDLTENAVAWLKLIPEDLRKTGPVVPDQNWKESWTRFRHALGWRVVTEKVRQKRYLPKVEAVHGEWANDVNRHTYASMHYAHHQNEALLQVQMGHRSAKMLHEHYRAVRTRKEAAIFWGLKPMTIKATREWLAERRLVSS